MCIPCTALHCTELHCTALHTDGDGASSAHTHTKWAAAGALCMERSLECKHLRPVPVTLRWAFWAQKTRWDGAAVDLQAARSVFGAHEAMYTTQVGHQAASSMGGGGVLPVPK